MKKLFALILSIVLTISISLTANADTLTLKSGEPYKAALSGDDRLYFTFIAEQSGNYRFFAESLTDTCAGLYNSNEDLLVENDDGEIDLDFSIEYSCTAGEEYTLVVFLYDSPEYSHMITVNVQKLCDHPDVTETPGLAPTCTEPGYTLEITCNDCGKIIQERLELEPEHTDADSDYSCDICGERAVRNAFSKNGVTYTEYTCGDLVISGSGATEYVSNYMSDSVKQIIINEGITEIGVNSFYDLNNVETVILPKSLEYIDSYVFNSPFIKQIYIPENVSYIDSYAFAYPLESITVDPDNMNYKNDSFGAVFTYDGKTMLFYPTAAPAESYTVPNGVVTLANNLFSNAKSLKNVVIPASVLNIGADVFNKTMLEAGEYVDDCLYLGDLLIYAYTLNNNILTVREGTRVICSYAISGYYIDIVLPESLESISDYAVSAGIGTFAYDNFTLPGGLKYIGDFGFRYILSNIEIPASVEHIGKSAFTCRSTSVDEANPYFSSDSEGAIYNKDKTELVCFPSDLKKYSYTVAPTVKTIREFAFSDCDLVTVLLPDGLVTIDDCAFFGCLGLNYIIIPDSVKTVGRSAFYACNLLSIVFPASVESIGADAFCDIKTVAVLNPDCDVEAQRNNRIIVGYNGSTAQTLAQNSDVYFSSLEEGHSHIYFPRITTAPTCDESGVLTYTCPCGNSESITRNISALHHYNCIEVPTENGYEYTCNDCGYVYEITYEDCDCLCHKANEPGIAGWFYSIFYNLFVKFCKLFNINQFCECGRQHF